MAERRKQPRKRVSTKQVQETEKLPPPTKIPDAKPAPEVDESAWGRDGLTEKQRKFVIHYMTDAAGNATKAAGLAGYRDDNYDAMRVTAHQTLTSPNVQRALERMRGAQYGTPEDVRNAIAAIAFQSGEIFKLGEDGKLVADLDKLAEHGALGLVKEVSEEGVKVGENVTLVKRKIKLYDRLKALELQAKLNGQMVEKHEHSGEVRFNPITFDGDKEASE